MSNDYEIFKGKSLASLFQDIYENQNYNRNQLDVLTKNITAMIKDGDTAVQIIPMIKEKNRQSILSFIVIHKPDNTFDC